MAKTETTTETASDKPADQIDVAVWKPPMDPGDAGGAGNGDQRNFAPGTMQEAVGDVSAAEAAAREAGQRSGRP